MPADTTERTTTRPNVSEELDDRLAEVVNPLVRIPGDRLTFGDRLEVLLDEYDQQQAELAQLEKKVERLEDQLADARNSGGLMQR